MSTTYRAVMLTKQGGPDVLETVELPLRDPAAGEARVRVLACGVGATDVLMRRGNYIYAPKRPFVPGYDVVGEVDAVGANVTNVKVGDKVCALTVHGGYAEMLYRDASELVVVPPGLDDAEVVALILNYATAYQAIHRTAKQTTGTALVTGANGGVGQALLQLLKIAGVTAYGAASKRSHELIASLGAIPVESREQPIDVGVRALVPGGVDVAYDGLGGRFVAVCRRATRRGGRVVGIGFSGAVKANGNPSTAATLRGFLSLFVVTPLTGRKGSFYGITALYRKNRQAFLDDLPRLFELLAARKIAPKIAARLPLLDARSGNAMIEAGGIDGKIVLVRDV